MSIIKKIEKERRFILVKAPDLSKSIERINIKQWYEEAALGVIRYRKSIYHIKEELIFEKINKIVLGKGEAEEIIHEISRTLFTETVNTSLPSIIKTRYIYKTEKLTFEVDVYDHLNLVIMEVELPPYYSIDEPIDIPDFLNNLIIKEITGEKEYSNYNLAKINQKIWG